MQGHVCEKLWTPWLMESLVCFAYGHLRLRNPHLRNPQFMLGAMMEIGGELTFSVDKARSLDPLLLDFIVLKVVVTCNQQRVNASVDFLFFFCK